MNAILSMCHFCEVHGPKILFCTQPLKLQQAGNAVYFPIEHSLLKDVSSGSSKSYASPDSSRLSVQSVSEHSIQFPDNSLVNERTEITKLHCEVSSLYDSKYMI